MRRGLVCVVAMCGLTLLPLSVADAQQQAAPATDESEELAKKLSNPISDLVSVPFQFNWAQNVGPFDLTQFILNVQPVIPFSLNKDWNMIVRVIAPFVGQPSLVVDSEPAFGLGDTTNSFFFSPTTTGSFTIGVGPAFVLPSTQIPTIGSGKWSAGPTVVALRQEGEWTYGLSSFGTFPASYLLGYGFFPAHPDIGPTWKIRAAITILLPRKKA
jgi:hypothetical protein